jgi:hypothetical protein
VRECENETASESGNHRDTAVHDDCTFCDGDEEKSYDEEKHTVVAGAAQTSLGSPVKTTSKTTSAGKFASGHENDGDVGDDDVNENEDEDDDQSEERQGRIASCRNNHH